MGVFSTKSYGIDVYVKKKKPLFERLIAKVKKLFISIIPKMKGASQLSVLVSKTVEISDLEADEFIALIDRVLDGTQKTFGMENGAIILEWRTDNAELLAKAQRLFEAYGLRFGVYSKGVVLRVLPTTGRYMAPKFNIL